MKNKKNIVVFIDWFTPGYKAGGPVRSCVNLIEQLKDEYNFYVITSDTDYRDIVPYKNILVDNWNILESNVSVYYFSEKRLTYSNIKRLVTEIKDVHKYYLNGIFSYYFTLLPLLILKNKSNLILAPRGMFAPSALAIKSYKKEIFISLMKLSGLYNKPIFHATSPGEIEDIKKKIGNKTTVLYAPNLPRKMLNSNFSRSKNKKLARLFYLARISPEKNLLYALERLRDVKSQIVFDIYGVINDENYWRDCEKVINMLPPNINVNYKGIIRTVDIYKTICQYHFLFLPTRGENFGHSIIESLSVGCPVIISDQTPWKNLCTNGVGWDFSLENETAFINAIESCAEMDQVEYNVMSDKAYTYAQKFVLDSDTLKMNKALLG